MTDPSSCKPPTHRLLNAARPLETARPRKMVLPLNSAGAVLLGGVNVFQATSQVRDLHTSRLLVADPKNWRISSLRTAPRIGGYQVRGNHPALSDSGPESFAKLPALPVNDGITLEIEYIGSHSWGEAFVGCLCMEDGQARALSDASASSDRNGNAALSLRAESLPVLPGEQVCLALPSRAHDFFVSELTLRNVEPTHWLINDIVVGGDTLLVDDGDLPGELLAARPERMSLRLGRLRAKEDLIVKATYIGPLASASLSYEAIGSEVPLHEEAADSAFLPLSSSVTASGLAFASSKISVPTGYAFLPEEIILRDPDNWVVLDIREGTKALFASSGLVPGALFGAQTRGCQLNFPAVCGGDCMSMTGSYSGSHIAGARFVCGAVGRVVQMPSREV